MGILTNFNYLTLYLNYLSIAGSEKLDVEGTDLLELLSHLEGELQARDIAIAALKSEQLKRVLYGLHVTAAASRLHQPSTQCSPSAANDSYSTSSGDNKPQSTISSAPPLQCPLSALQRDKLHGGEANHVEESLQVCAASAESEIAALQAVIEKQRAAAAKIADCLRQSESQRLKALDDLHAERQKYRQVTLASGVAAITASKSGGADGENASVTSAEIAAAATLNYELEQERNRYKDDYEKELAEKQKLEAALKDVTANFEEEKAKQKQIVLVLLSDRKKLHKLYREEKKRSEDLAQMLQAGFCVKSINLKVKQNNRLHWNFTYLH